MQMKLLFFTSILSLLPAITYASPANDPANCPPASLVASHYNFDYASQFGEVWAVHDSSIYDYKSRKWFTSFIVEINVTNSEEALARSKDLFKSVQLETPELFQDGAVEACIYARSQQTGIVSAIHLEGLDEDAYKAKVFNLLQSTRK